MTVHLAAGEAVFAHECEGHRHSITVAWGIGTPALDENTLPPCADCGVAYERVAACTGGRIGDGHDCHPISGHVSRSDDHTIGLASPPEPDPLEIMVQRRALVHWVIGQKQVIEQTTKLLEANDFPNVWLREDCQLTHDLAIAQLKARGVEPAD